MAFKKYIIGFIFLASIAFLSACSYSFTGASVPPHLETIHIPNFTDNTGKGEPDLDTRFTFQTIQKFIDDNNLQVTDRKAADCLIECTITRLTDLPNTISGEDELTENRVTINVRVIYRDLVEKKMIFDQNFSNYVNYSTTDGDVTTNRNAAIDGVIERISEDILLGVVANW